MTRSTIVILAVVTGFLSSCVSRNPAPISQSELVSHSQEMFNAVASGDQAPWQKYFADDAMYFDEKGRAMDKAALVKDVTPLPKGYSGNITVVNAKRTSRATRPFFLTI